MRTAFRSIRRDPVYTIGVILAVGLLIFALYFIGPWYVGGPATSIGAVFDSGLSRFVLGVLYLIPSVAVLVGTTKGLKWRMFGTFGVALAFLFITILRLLTFGFTPVIWIFMLICALISAMVYLYVSVNGEDG